ncbi:FecR family protein [Parapedobacter sp. 10938]|uniref:FecR family protein n=1 Tax=Parapedobacter flavus TaxID=3110225 RepID=UPI002DB67C65|nr:FecR domain-containing protein [Parapedobacter sp. 10938]MEC3879161.1 FecR domain-containing protein [Parapedobacter sp. 10938]
MEESKLREICKRYLSGSATRAERYIIERWLESVPDGPHKESQQQTESQQVGEAFADALQNRILVRTFARERRVQRRSRNRLWLASAAGLIFALATSIWLYNTRYEPDQMREERVVSRTFATGVRQVKQLTLPDGSVVFLNANSELNLMGQYGKDKREIQLSGEAFFDVVPNPDAPFTVVSDKVAVHVLGTSFNVQSYGRLREVVVSVNTGRVRVSDTASNVMSELTPGQELYFHKDHGTFEVAQQPVQRTGWREGRLVLHRATFEELAQSFENLYGLQLTTTDEQVLSHRFYVTLQATTRMEEAVETICTILQKKFRKEATGNITIY